MRRPLLVLATALMGAGPAGAQGHAERFAALCAACHGPQGASAQALTPHLVVGFTSNNKAVQKVFTALQRIVIERLYRPLFAIDIRALRDERLFIERALETTRAALLEIRQAVDAGSNVS